MKLSLKPQSRPESNSISTRTPYTNGLISREDILEWYRACALGEITETHQKATKEGDVIEYESPCPIAVRKACVDKLCELLGYTEAPGIQVNQTTFVLASPDRVRALDETIEVEEEVDE